MTGRLIRFVHGKFWREKKTAGVLFLLALALIAMVLYNSAQDKAYWDKYLNYLHQEFTLIKNQISYWENEIEALERSESDDEAALERLDQQYWFYRRQYVYNYELQTIVTKIDKGHATPRQLLAVQVKRDEHILNGMAAGYEYLEENPARVSSRLAINRYLLDEDIEVLHSPYAMTATNFIYHLTSYPWIMIVVVAVSLLNVDMFSADVEGGAYKVLYAQPIQRTRIFAAKCLVHLGNSLAIICGVIVLAFVIISLVNGVGQLNYPVPYYSGSFQTMGTQYSQDTASFLPWWNYFLRTIPSFLMVCGFTLIFAGFASLVLNSTAAAMNFLICMLFLDINARILFAQGSIFFAFWPFAAVDINKVMEGLHSLSSLAYLAMLTGLAVILFTAGRLLLKRKDLTGGLGQ